MKCPDCDVEMTALVANMVQCPQCKKIMKISSTKKESSKEKTEMKSGEWFMKNTGISKKWEICEKGLIINKTSSGMIAAVICHSPSLPSMKYIRLSWFKKSINLHAGMIKLTSSAELNNLIKVLNKIDEDFNDDFEKILKTSATDKTGRLDDFNTELNNIEVKFDTKKKECPNCKSKMKLSKNKKYYLCEPCGEIVVVEDGRPIFNIPTEKLPLTYSSNFPVNYYLPDIGITYKWYMAEWKAVVIIHAKDNPDKRWLRFYWWSRNLQQYISNEYSSMGSSSSLAWESKKGAGSTNVYEKSLLPKIVEALETLKKELNW